MEPSIHVAVVIRNKDDIWEGTRSALGLAASNYFTYLFIMDSEVEMTEAYRENLEWFQELEGQSFSNHSSNVKEHGFEHLSLEQMGEKLSQVDLVIPFGVI